MQNKNRRVILDPCLPHTWQTPPPYFSRLGPGRPLPMDGESLNLLGRLNETSPLRESALRRETLNARFHVRDPPFSA
jgi:hypothetical protein